MHDTALQERGFKALWHREAGAGGDDEGVGVGQLDNAHVGEAGAEEVVLDEEDKMVGGEGEGVGLVVQGGENLEGGAVGGMDVVWFV